MIKLQEVSKSFDHIQALNNVSFEVKQGEIFGFLGPNGAGKSTTLNILSTLLNPDQGEIFLDGINLKEDKNGLKFSIGVVPQEISLYEDLTAMENLIFWGSLYNMGKKETRTIALKVLNLVGLVERKDDLVKTFSGGMKRRINIAAALLHNPKVLLLDEPTAGVDPQSRNHIFELLEQLNQEGITIIYTTHYMEEVERLCDRIAIIDLGKIIAQGSMEELRKTSNVSDALSISIKPVSSDLKNQLGQSKSITMNETGDILNIECENIAKEISGIISHLNEAGIVIKSIETQQADLESIFLKLTGKQLRD